VVPPSIRATAGTRPSWARSSRSWWPTRPATPPWAADLASLLDPRVEAALADPPATGLLLFAVPDGPLDDGDVLVSLGGRTITDEASFDAAYRAAFKTKSVPIVVLRGGKKVTIDADRSVVIFAGRVAVMKGQARPVRPAATEASFAFRATDLRCERLMNAFGKPATKVQGFEHHRITMKAKVPTLQTEVDFTSYDHVRFTARVTPTGSRYSDADRDVHVDTKRSKDWPEDGIPSLLARLGGLFVPRTRGACVHYSPIPEDGGRSPFPLVLHPAPMAIRCAGPETLKVGRATVDAWRFDHLRFGDVTASTWVDDEGALVRHAELATVLRPVAST
jgi:hypothetical protein